MRLIPNCANHIPTSPTNAKETRPAFFGNPNITNSLRKGPLGRWDLDLFGKLSVSAAGNPGWEADPCGCKAANPGGLGSLGNTELRLARDLGREPSSHLPSFKPCH